MRHQIDRKIKGRDASDGTDREAAHDAPSSGGGFLPVERKVVAIYPGGLFGGDVEGEDGALDFGARGLDGLAGFLRESAGELLFAFGHGRGNATEDTLALESRKAARGTEGFDSSGDGSLSMLFAPLNDAGDQAAVIGGSNLNEVAVLMPPAIDKETMRRNRRNRHLRHVLLAPRNGLSNYRTLDAAGCGAV